MQTETNTEAEMLDVEVLLKQRAELDGQIKRALRATRDADLAKCKVLIERHDFTPAELGFECGAHCASGAEIKAPAVVVQIEKQKPEKERAKLLPKFRNPETGDTWTGRGLKPKWLEQALAEGRLLSEFLIDAPEQERAQGSAELKGGDAPGEPIMIASAIPSETTEIVEGEI